MGGLMIAIDTNILIRYITQDHPKQAKLAEELLEKHCSPINPGWINLLVVAETFWVLERTFKIPKVQLLEIFKDILTTEEFSVEDSEIVYEALKDYEKRTADFIDYIIARRNLAGGYKITYTFDKKAARHPGFKLLS